MRDTPPDRSVQQRMEALERANEVRIYRAGLKRDIKAGRVDAISLLEDPPEGIETMKLFDLLCAIPKLGRVKVNRIVVNCRVSPSRTIGGLTMRQRGEIISYLRRR
jgi:hypothetical protein